MKSSTIAILSIALIAVIVAGYFALTYPRVVLGISVSFDLNATSEEREFNVSFLDNHVQVQVNVLSGAAAWTAQILSGNKVLWNHTRLLQGGQTTYFSDWIELSSGTYNFTFGIVGGFLNASVNVVSKGGFW